MRIVCEEPFDFRLSWRVFSSFSGRTASERGSLAMWWDGRPTSVLLNQTSLSPPVLELIVDPMPRQARPFGELMRDVLNADLRLEPFYRRARKDKTLHPVVNALIGLKPFRPPDIFQMLATAVTEQQISMAAARNIRDRLVSAYGTRTGRVTAFPRPRDIASLSVQDLRGCGLSQRKAEYLIGLAGKMESGELDPAAWEEMGDGELIRLLKGYRGIGEWTAEYVLLRGLGRPDVIPASDLGIRRVLGRYLADGRDLSEGEVRRALEAWSPWRGLLAFYLLAHYRMSHMGLDQAQ